MKKSKKFALLTGAVVGATAIAAHVMKKKAEKTTYEADLIEPIEKRKMGLYEKYGKRILDIACATAAIVVFSPLYLGVAALVKLKLGSPVLFTQDRPGLIGKDGKETVFKMYKFRTMTDERDENGELLPDDVRLTKFGKWLRNTSLDELPEAFNILNGTMSVIGPRPQLVRDMTFMTKEQRARHTAKPGLSGLAQVNGRNGISWEEKLDWDRKYIQNVSFAGDVKIIFDTVKKAFIKQEGITQDDMATAEDFGDYLLRMGKVDVDTYRENQAKAGEILGGKSIDKKDSSRIEKVEQSAKSQKYSVLMSLYKKEKPEYLRLAIDSMINQTVPPDEIVIVEDGPLTDELYAVLDEYPILHRVKNETNLGLGLALNVGLKKCKNELVARMDTDDCSKPERCEKQLLRFSEKPYLAIVGSHIDEFVGDVSNVISQRVVPTTTKEIYDYAKRRSAFNHPAVMYSKTAVLDAGGYADLKRNQDVDLFGRMQFLGYKAENIDEALLWFRSSDELAKRRKSWQNTWSYIATIRKFWKMGYSSFVDYAMVGIAQTGMYLMPVKLQNFVYRKFLRK
ncbi:sugar transferase [Ruminococcus bicirculans (ex Wegman et al. 2014)]|uniref:sugar transferase n=3 Tax=Ruminococcus TaxID=1263 RepID=UPI00241E2A28|nr:sugar transferase [Ruminococcus bicirculans (ex Wegman et al. 2014)]